MSKREQLKDRERRELLLRGNARAEELDSRAAHLCLLIERLLSDPAKAEHEGQKQLREAGKELSTTNGFLKSIGAGLPEYEMWAARGISGDW